MNIKQTEKNNTPYPRVCAHRGFNTIAPENSLPAFGAAIALGAQEIEFDIWPSKDMEIVVCHDDNLNRIVKDCENIKKISDMTYEEIVKEDIGKKFNKAFKGLTIARFEDVLKTFSGQTTINLHIKSIKYDNITLNEKVFNKIIDLIYKYNWQEHIYIMTGDDDIMQTALNIAPQIVRCMGAGEAPAIQVERAIKFKCQKLQLFKPFFDKQMIDKAHANNISCNVYFSDNPAEAIKFLDMGIDTILTNDYLNISLAVKRYIKEKYNMV